ncbi:MAG: DJ-1/PfpI family protein [Gemmatimonadetes bacterium]|nr:DJ-1/PfpI family protein [Gemmatimonadota bacterium]
MRHLLIGLVLTLSVSAPACSNEPESGQLSIGVLAFDGVLTSEVTAPMEVFGAASHKDWFASYRVLLVSGTDQKRITTAEGLKLVADATIHDDIEYEVLLVPGAYELEELTSNDTFMSFIRDKGKAAGWLGSNCSGAFLLAHAGLLDGVKATTWAGGEADLKKAYPKVDVQFDTNVVIDGNTITSNGGVVSYEAALTLLGRLSSPEHAQEIAEILQFTRVQGGELR